MFCTYQILSDDSFTLYPRGYSLSLEFHVRIIGLRDNHDEIIPLKT